MDKLNDLERMSGLWTKLRKQYTDELAILRRKNDSDLDAVETARLRGRIFEIKRFLDLESPEVVSSDHKAAGSQSQ